MEQTNERWWEAEVLRTQGRLLLAQQEEPGGETDLDRIEAHFQRAIAVTRRQQAKSWELRATLDLCRPWQREGRVEEARQALWEIYGWLTEGHQTPT